MGMGRFDKEVPSLLQEYEMNKWQVVRGNGQSWAEGQTANCFTILEHDLTLDYLMNGTK